MQTLRWIFVFWMALFSSEQAKANHVKAELVPVTDSLQAGTEGDSSNRIGIRLEMEAGWHTYWRYPGDSGLPTEAKWDLPQGWIAGALEWPVPERILVPPLVNYGYESEVFLAAPVQIPADAKGDYTIRVKLSWLACKEECIPEKADLSLRVKVTKEKGKSGPFSGAFAKLKREQPVPLDRKVEVLTKKNLLGISFEDPEGSFLHASKLDFFPLAPLLVKGDAPPAVEKSGTKITLWLSRNEPFDPEARKLPGMIIAKNNKESRTIEVNAALPAGIQSFKASLPVAGEKSPPSSWLLLVFAFLGGLILNLMPCVFPVLGIKVMSLVRQNTQETRHSRKHGLAYGLGVLVCFWILASALILLRSAGQAVGWGFQLQQPAFVIALILLFSFVAADLAGFIQWSGRWMGAGEKLAGKEGISGSFFTGILAVVVATPCTAPFMGTAIGAAIGEPAWIVALVFTALALGLALPFVLLCYFPSYLKLLPRPGAWMERLKELLAFPIAATVVWLLWVLAQQIGADGAFKVEGGILILFFSVWLRRRFSAISAQVLSLVLLFLGIAACLAGAKSGSSSAAFADSGWIPYSEAALEKALDEKRPVFVDFTAAWCLTCQVNRKLVLERESVQKFFQEKGMVLLLADWTNRDPGITKALEQQGRIGVPLYLVYPAGARQARVLPQILTEDILRSSF